MHPHRLRPRTTRHFRSSDLRVYAVAIAFEGHSKFSGSSPHENPDTVVYGGYRIAEGKSGLVSECLRSWQDQPIENQLIDGRPPRVSRIHAATV